MLKLMIIIVSIIALSAIVLLIGRMMLSRRFNKEVESLFSHSKNISDRAFNYNQLLGLPQPVQQYFKHVLRDGYPYISYVRITHDGQFKTGFDKDWVNITGEQYATTEKPGFIWKGTTAMFTARDMFISDKGRLVVSLFSLFKVVDAKGGPYNQGELLRWLGESILYPTNFLSDERLQWSPINSQKAKLTFNYKELSLFFLITFNQLGEITQMETERYMDDKNIATWIINVADYKEMNGIFVPTKFEVLWRLEKGDFSYAKFNIKKIEYNNPSRF